MFTNKNDILTYAKSIRDFLTELIEVSKNILHLFWNNKFTILVLCVLYLIYEGLNYIAYEMPKRTVVKYYELVDNKRLTEAWNMLTPQCQVRWKNGIEDFRLGYGTLATTKILKVENYTPGDLWEATCSDKKQLVVDIIVVENFRGSDLIDTLTRTEKNDQIENSFWLRLRHKELSIHKLKTDSLPSYRSALKLVRRYRKVFTIQKNPTANFLENITAGNWLITDVDNKEIGIVFDTTFYYK